MAKFTTPNDYSDRREETMTSFRGKLMFTACECGERFLLETTEDYNKLSRKSGSNKDVMVTKTIIKRKHDGTIVPELVEHVGGADLYIFQNLFDPKYSINDNCMELYSVIRTAKDNGAGHIVPVLRYLAYMRQDRPTSFRREGTLSKLEADLLKAAGATDVVIYDPHFPQIRGFFDINPVILSSFTFFYDKFSFLKNRDDAILVAPDVGASKDNLILAKELGIEAGVVTKNRTPDGKSEITGLIGDFENKFIAGIKDDILGTGGTFADTVKAIYDKGVREIYGGFSYGEFLKDCVAKLDDLYQNYGLKKIFLVDNINQPEEIRKKPWFSESSISRDIALTINAIHYGDSVSEHFYRPDLDKPK